MKLNKWIILVVLLFTGALILSACGGATDEPAVGEPAEVVEEEADEEMAEEEMEEEAVEEEVAEEEMEEEAVVEEEAAEEEMEEEEMEEEAAPEVSLTIWADAQRSEVLLPLAEEFQSTYGVGLNIETLDFGDIRDQMVIAAPAGEGPDIIIGAHDWLGQLVSSGLLAPIDLGDKASSFTDVSLTGCTFEGELYCMPYAVENMAFFYNTDLVDAAPTTWDEAIEVGTALQDAGDVTYGFALTGTSYDGFPLMTAFGGYIFGRDDAGNYNPQDLGVDGDGMVAAGQWMADQVASGFMSDNTDWDTTHTLFETGEIPFLMAGPWALERLRESGVPYGIANFPDGGRPFAGVQGFMINALSENTLLAQAFLTEFVATDAVMTEIYVAGNRPSAFIETLAATDDADVAAFGAAGAEAVLSPAIPEMGAVWGSWGDSFTLIIQGEDATETLATGAAQIRELIGGAAAGMVNAPGSWQAAADVGCGDWDPACEGTALAEGDDGLFSASFSLPAGDYEVKVAHDGAWTENYGVDGASDGDNYAFTMDADGTVTYTYDPETHLLEIATE